MALNVTIIEAIVLNLNFKEYITDAVDFKIGNF